ncbi:MAG: hypothetical protein ACLURU_07625 [Finegoldia magna]
MINPFQLIEKLIKSNISFGWILIILVSLINLVVDLAIWCIGKLLGVDNEEI